MNVILKHDKKEYKIKKVNEEDSLFIESKNNDIKINVYDKEVIKNIVDKKFNKKYKKFLQAIIETDEDDGNYEIILSEIDKYRSFIIRNYGKYLNEKTLNKYLKLLNVLNAEIENRLRKEIVKSGKSR